MKKILLPLLMLASLQLSAQNNQGALPQVKTANGLLSGVNEASGIRSYKGIPFAEPPVGKLRWVEPQPVKNWTGVRKADHFGPQAMQRAMYSDMIFRSDGKSEDCLYLNVWTPAKSSTELLPVLVYFYGGGFSAGDGSEGRYDGESMAQKGMVAITVNYRLGVFGFMAHPALTAESAHHASGNYGLLDQHAALEWVQKNIAAFGGDPKRVTIAGESAGSMSVSAQMASPLSKGLFAGAIAESGALLGNLSPTPLAVAEENGQKFAAAIKATSLKDLRNMPGDSLLKLSANFRFSADVDGYLIPKMPRAIFEAGEQMHVPLLVGWNSAEGSYRNIIGNRPSTVQSYKDALLATYGKEKADAIFAAYPAATDADVEQVATELASDNFIAYSTWKLADLQSKTGGKPVYKYYYTRKRPAFADGKPNNAPGAVHSAEIEYALGNLRYNKAYNWTPEDYKVSETMQNYFANFIKTGNPNGKGLPTWSSLQERQPPSVMIIDVNSTLQPDTHASRYALQEKWNGK